MTISRRTILEAGVALPLLATTASAAPAPAEARAPGERAVKPLPFDPAKLKGLSEKLLVSHHDNNYAGAVKNLNKVRAELAQLKPDAPGFVVAGLRQSELTFHNSAVLHEAYFGNLGGDGKASGPVEKALAAAFGSFGRFEEQLRALGGALGGGSGWAVLALDLPSGELGLFWSGHHTQVPAAALPLLVLDMYEHAYQMDYGAAAARYLDAFMANLSWAEVNRRFEQGLKVAAGLRG